MTCRSCGAPLFFIISSATGKRIPLNAAPDPRGSFALQRGPQGVVGTVIHDPPKEGEERWTSHFATCPQASQWRKS